MRYHDKNIVSDDCHIVSDQNSIIWGVKMNIFEEFADSKEHFYDSFERKMARAYRDTVEELVAASKDLWSTMRVEQDDDQALQYFLPEYEDPALKIEDAEIRIAEIQTDIETFVNIVGGHSRQKIVQKFHRYELDIANAKRKARIILKKAIQENPGLSRDNVEKSGVVQAAYKERDSKIAELTPIIAELEKKMQRAEEILKKYG